MIKLENMSFKYGVSNYLYNDFNLELEKGKVYGILGRNGSGKTTLLNILTSLLPGYEGTVQIDGVEAKTRKREYLKKFYYLPEMIGETKLKLEDFLSIGRSYENWNEEKFLGLLKREGLNLNTKVKKLSKGWKKRVYFYFAISINPDIMILDEVSEGVDIIAQKDIITDILDYFTEEKSVIISSHHIEEFENIIDKFIVIDNGKLIFEGDKFYIENEFGWVEKDKRSKIDDTDVIMEKKILGEKYFLVKNRSKYLSIAMKNIDLTTFLKILVNKEAE